MSSAEASGTGSGAATGAAAGTAVMPGMGTAVGAAAGAIVGFVGGLLATNAQSEAADKNAELKREQADELLVRQQINDNIMREQADLAGHEALSRSGNSGSADFTGIGDMLRIHRDTEANIANNNRDAQFKAKMLRAGADVDTQLASDIQTAGIVSGSGSLLTGAAQAYNIYKGPSESTVGLGK